MALILVRGENNSKLLSAIADMERHGNLNLTTKPKVVDAKLADSLVEGILNSKLKTKSNAAIAFFASSSNDVLFRSDLAYDSADTVIVNSLPAVPLIVIVLPSRLAAMSLTLIA